MSEPMPFRRPAAVEPTMTSLVRAIIAQAHGALDRGVRAADYAASTWPNDASVPLVLRASVSPTLMANATATVADRAAIRRGARAALGRAGRWPMRDSR